MPGMNRIGIVGESALHSALKQYYAGPGDELETLYLGCVVDIKARNEIIEIQTRHFGKLKPKLARLLTKNVVRVVYPISKERWILRIDKQGNELSRRRSPRKGRIEDIFLELVHLGDWVVHENIILEAVFVKDEVLWRDDGSGSWRRNGWSVVERRLVEIGERTIFTNVCDYLALLPDDLPKLFTTKDLAIEAKMKVQLAGKMIYCLNKMGLLNRTGKQGKSYLYEKSNIQKRAVPN